jgi:hypothetical protein
MSEATNPNKTYLVAGYPEHVHLEHRQEACDVEGILGDLAAA